MKGDEIIFYCLQDNTAKAELQMAVLRYTLLTHPFSKFNSNLGYQSSTFQKDYERNYAVAMFASYLKALPISFDRLSEKSFCKSAYSDFNINGEPWLVMNKMIRGNNIKANADFVHLPALVPNRHESDRWSQRTSGNGETTCFVFTFLKTISEEDVPNRNLTLPPEISEFMLELYEKYNSDELTTAPFSPGWFWNQIEQLGGIPKDFKLPAQELIICGVADSSSFDYFSSTDGQSEFAYALYLGRWYDVKPNGGGLVFRNSGMQTHFRNATCPMAALPSFFKAIENLTAEKVIKRE